MCAKIIHDWTAPKSASYDTYPPEWPIIFALTLRFEYVGCTGGRRRSSHVFCDLHRILFRRTQISLLSVFDCKLTNILITASLYLFSPPFNSLSWGIPPSEARITFHRSSSTFFMGKCGAVPLQNFVIIPNSLTANNSSSNGFANKLCFDIQLVKLRSLK